MSVIEFRLISTIVNLIIGLPLLSVFITQRSKLLNTQTDYLTLGLVIFGLLFSIFINVFVVIYISLQQQINFRLCQYVGTVVSLITGANQSLHALIAMERYLRIVGTDFRGLVPVIYLIDFCAIFGSISIMWIRGYYEIESKMWCFYDFTSRDAIDLAANLIVITFICINTLIILGCYISIYRKIDVERKKVGKILNIKNQKVMAKKFLIITVSYFLAYSPSYSTFLYRFISGLRVSAELEMTATSLTLLEPSITFSLLLYLNKNYRMGVWKLIGKAENEEEAFRSTDVIGVRSETRSGSEINKINYNNSE